MKKCHLRDDGTCHGKTVTVVLYSLYSDLCTHHRIKFGISRAYKTIIANKGCVCVDEFMKRRGKIHGFKR